MLFGLPTETVLVLLVIVFAGGLVMGIAGFGYAVVSTATLAAIISPETAVVVMIVPLLASNVSLVTELDREAFRSCLLRFWPYVGAAAIGTVIGMALLNRVPATVLSLALGLFTLSYVLFSQRSVTVPGLSSFTDWCFRESTTMMVGVGAVSGFIFGASNVGVQVVAYLDSLNLDRDLFVGVLALLLVGISALRVGLAFAFGLYGTGELLVLSILAAIPGLVGVSTGKRVRTRLSERRRTVLIYGLLTVVGVKLTLDGIAVL
jgi:hypothetical protein